MWFKNLQVYRLYHEVPSMLAAALDAGLRTQLFVPLEGGAAKSQGWAPLLVDGDLVHVVNRQLILRFNVDEKVVPAAMINRVAKARAAELQEQQGFPPGKKAMRELKERAVDELLPRAFPRLSSTLVWIDPVNGWLVVDAATSARADDVIKALLKAVDKLPLESLRVQRSPAAAMTGWLAADDVPEGFTVDQDTELRATGESRAAVRFVKHTLDVDDLRRHIAAGKQCTRLALTWKSRISFVLTEGLDIKGVRPLDVLTEGAAVTADDRERLDNDIVLMTGELATLLADVVDALGGEAKA